MNDFLNQVRQFVGIIPFTSDAVAMYFCMIDPNTRIEVKLTIAGALTYFLAPMDTIPDVIVGLGFTDDASVIALALATIGSALTSEHRQKARAFFEN
ncbi:YkvA family protein [Leptolyngbya sp. AN03gr2]|uniref:YkvA family protein n=1 Tax=unclassified Leptolyngbya TaxID=2650499 RepID=UPI003D31D630